MTQIPIPEMTVEERSSTTPHRVPEPDLSDANMAVQLRDATQLNHDAAQLIELRRCLQEDLERQIGEAAWPQSTLDILRRHISTLVPDVMDDEIIYAAEVVLQCKDIGQLASWVQDDQCSEVFNRMLAHCVRENQPHRTDEGFIDGSGIGYLRHYVNALKISLEKTFDAKWYYKVVRPIEWLWTKSKFDMTPVVNAINPGHWSNPQGHATKSFTALEVLRYVFTLESGCNRQLLIAACLFGHGRDANFIHYPMDTYASGYNTGLDEFKDQP